MNERLGFLIEDGLYYSAILLELAKGWLVSI